jgi:translation initiation factor IF-1
MASKDVVVRQGVVEEALPATKFRVKLEDGTMILAHLAGKMRMYYIRILPGDHVTVEVSKYDGSKGRIIRRL